MVSGLYLFFSSLSITRYPVPRMTVIKKTANNMYPNTFEDGWEIREDSAEVLISMLLRAKLQLQSDRHWIDPDLSVSYSLTHLVQHSDLHATSPTFLTLFREKA